MVLCLFVTPHVFAKDGRKIEDSDRVTLYGNIHPHAHSQFEVSSTDRSLRMERMVLSLRITAEKQASIQHLVANQQNPSSENYHKWLTPEEFGERFGPSSDDLSVVTGWLTSQGFRVENVPKGRTWINFTGTVADVERTFRTQMRNYKVKGRLYHANALNPSIPRALGDLVAGISTLHNFPRRQMNSGIRPFFEGRTPSYTSGANKSLAPGDFATIYNLNPLYSAGIDGTGQSIAIVGRTHSSSSPANWKTFRTTFGLPTNAPQILVNGTDPGDQGLDEDVEADLDVEWSGAIAKNATIKFVTSLSTASTDGVDLSAQYIIDNDLAPVMSVSFGQCEAQMGEAENIFYNNLWAQAAAQGITVFVSTGDSGAAGCDYGSDDTGTGPAVNGLASTPYNVAVGGTLFNEGSGSYWNTSNGLYGVSAKSYVPETAWNESASANYCPADQVPCTGLWATGGGASSLYDKPAWQAGLGVPADGKRDIPDVSLSASSHDGYRIKSQAGWYLVGGTSASSPAFAGIMALIVQKTGQRQGNANARFYQLAEAQRAPGGPVAYHDILSGNNTVPGVTGYAATDGYDLATGLGSVDGAQLVNHWVATAPGAPVIGAAVAGNGQVTVSFSPPITNGDSAITSYTVTSDPGGFTGSGTTSPITVGGLTNGLPYTFTVAAINSAGTSVPSSLTSAAVPATVPAPPSSVSAVGGNSLAIVSFSAPIDNGGSEISNYTVISHPDSITNTGTGSPITISGLTNGTLYSFSVTAANIMGSSTPSAASNTVRVPPLSQTITVTSVSPSSAALGSQFAVAASASSGLAVNYSSGTPGVCTNNGATFTMIASVGTCIVQYDQSGDGNYSAAPQVTGSTVAIQAYSLTVSLNGTGGGTVTNNPSGTPAAPCTYGNCSVSYPANATVLLLPTPNSGSIFGGWGGDCSNGGDCSVTMDANKNVTATFTLQNNVMINGTYYGTIASAYAAVADGDVVQMRSMEFPEDLVLSRGLSFTLRGGYDSGLSTRVGYTTINGVVIISGGGRVSMDRVIIK